MADANGAVKADDENEERRRKNHKMARSLAKVKSVTQFTRSRRRARGAALPSIQDSGSDLDDGPLSEHDEFHPVSGDDEGELLEECGSSDGDSMVDGDGGDSPAAKDEASHE
jgi:hypothetical protein